MWLFSTLLVNTTYLRKCCQQVPKYCAQTHHISALLLFSIHKWNLSNFGDVLFFLYTHNVQLKVGIVTFYPINFVCRISLSVEPVVCSSPSAAALSVQGCVTKDMTASKS